MEHDGWQEWFSQKASISLYEITEHIIIDNATNTQT